ncbi:ABC transporter ATP-binding protein [Chondromyces apiculatus]|uniref:Efflux ABC transporter, permease/ATP-binding protein n=1 Tax=Chondromyces apiculatus DSM 436 TaxID=1192034 RepID=A0A017SXY2_9BACT|nr:ABC transporter transmembrane domain-containing protein [Chondromyces apiculatus]EYF01146.1 efflux ABC transporter, permease/ATP-binding protein [Chondromyces apiculatus DSM 436]
MSTGEKTLASAPRSASIWRILSLARPERGRIALGLVCLAVGSGAGLVFPQVLRRIVDGALGEGGAGLAAVDKAAAWLVAVFFVQAIATAARAAIFTIAGERVVARLRTQLFDRLLEQEIGFFDERRTGELTSRLASDTGALQNAVSVNISMALRFVASVIGGVALLFYTSPRLTALMLGVVPPIALGAFAYGRRVRSLAREVQDALARSSEVAEESLAGIRTVRAFAAEPTEIRRYAAAVLEAFDVARRRARISSTFMGIASFAGYAAVALVLWYGGRLVTRGELTVGGLTSFLVYTLLVAFSLGGLTDLWADFMRASGAADRIFEMLDRNPAMSLATGEEPGHVEGHLDLQGVSFAYPSRPDAPVLRGIDLTVRPGEAVALVGPSGAGKSTIASLLLRLYDPTEGRVLLDGRDLRDLSPAWLRRRVGVVSQEPLLFSSSIAENIRYGRPDATDAEVEAAAIAASAHDFITRFPDGYRTRVGERGAQLSGGQKQRVAIARAVLKDPQILVLDEATSALDAESEHLVQGAMSRLMQGRTTLIIAHRLSTVMGADRVLVLEGGRLAQAGTHATLMAEEGLYRRLVERQLTGAPLASSAPPAPPDTPPVTPDHVA